MSPHLLDIDSDPLNGARRTRNAADAKESLILYQYFFYSRRNYVCQKWALKCCVRLLLSLSPYVHHSRFKKGAATKRCRREERDIVTELYHHYLNRQKQVCLSHRKPQKGKGARRGAAEPSVPKPLSSLLSFLTFSRLNYVLALSLSENDTAKEGGEEDSKKRGHPGAKSVWWHARDAQF